MISPVSFEQILPHDDDGDKEVHKFAYWRMKKSSFARFAPAFFLFLNISQPFSSHPRREITFFWVIWTTRAHDDQFFL